MGLDHTRNGGRSTPPPSTTGDGRRQVESAPFLAAHTRVDRTFRTPTVVYGVLLKDGLPLTADSLFAFAKVSLLQAATALEGMGARLEIISLARDRMEGQAA
jgi:uncharacterized protein (TIGR04141 family)